MKRYSVGCHTKLCIEVFAQILDSCCEPTSTHESYRHSKWTVFRGDLYTESLLHAFFSVAVPALLLCRAIPLDNQTTRDTYRPLSSFARKCQELRHRSIHPVLIGNPRSCRLLPIPPSRLLFCKHFDPASAARLGEDGETGKRYPCRKAHAKPKRGLIPGISRQ